MARQKKTFDEIVGDEKPQASKKTNTNTATQKITVASKATKQDEDKEAERLKEENESLQKMLASMQEQITALMKQGTSAPQVQVVKDVGSSGKKVKVMSLIHNPINVSTDVNGGGRVKSFDKYGDVRTIKFDDLSDMVSAYPNTFNKGYLYIMDNDVVNELGLTDEYSSTVYSKEQVDSIVNLTDETAVNLFIGMDKDLRDSTAKAIARNLKNGRNYDYNLIHMIKTETGIDIQSIADNALDLDIEQ